jgi:hypothetical protein
MKSSPKTAADKKIKNRNNIQDFISFSSALLFLSDIYKKTSCLFDYFIYQFRQGPAEL